MENIKIGYIGLGCRGKDLLENIVLAQKEQVVAVCDVYEDRAREGAKVVEAAGQPTPFVSTDYKDIIANEEVNTIIIATAWESHVEIALAAMYAGKAVAMEVGGAYSLEDCYKLVDAYEKTKTPFMFLENCCFGRRELMVLNMVEQGVLGEVVHCAGGYQHDLRDEIAFGKENRHYRLRNYLSRNCENYPTHDLGPIARILNINHGNRMLTLSSFASKSAGLHEFIMQNKTDGYYVKARLDEATGVYYVTDHVADKKDATRFVPIAKDGKGKILVKGLEDDEYTVTEIKTADGYTLLKKGIAVVISRKDTSASATVDGKQAAMLADNGSANALVPLSVVNTSGFDLPATGDRGVWMYGLAGILLMTASAACIIIARKRFK